MQKSGLDDERVMFTGKECHALAAALEVGMDGLEGDEYEAARFLAELLARHAADGACRVMVMAGIELYFHDEVADCDKDADGRPYGF